ncbi:lysophospholipase L1-like esterase [Pseudochelatococcus lubricantis]|uniref:Lysophospholipase L1-like esterase n=1 Tax=Pseudochelatococcus lubricantis TaxID=1538102 RepID=A0ABX0V164_9HYPH|nr:SGNH/GDSL hydrolase family protein [Pseudochelatococcus lubricantis]NIJ58304.1 lysophospholipase L1-like esterase [Pseudochelatococcus lubricantis]
MHARLPLPSWRAWSQIVPRGLPPYNRTTKMLIALGIPGLAAVAVAGALFMTAKREALDGYTLVRLRTIEAQAEQIEGDYILLAGDSHTERLYLPTLCGLPTLNAGLSGATLDDVSSVIAAAKIRPPKLTLLTIGTNEANLKRRPDAYDAVIRFRRNLDNLLSVLRWRSRRVVVSQIPPLQEGGAAAFSSSAIAAFDAVIGNTCTGETCARVALFPPADAGSEDGALYAMDGIHINRLADRINVHAREICSNSN